MGIVKKTIALDKALLNRIKLALNARSEEEAIVEVLTRFDPKVYVDEEALGLYGKPEN